MIGYKRLTKYKGEPLHTDMEVTDGDEIYERLAELEDMIEQGLLVRIPCKTGNIIYLPWFYNGASGIAELTVESVSIDTKEITTNLDSDDKGFLFEYNYGIFDWDDIGKTVFLTKAKAKIRLKELKRNKGNE